LPLPWAPVGPTSRCRSNCPWDCDVHLQQ
jgi:hypothetical protein